MVPDDRRLADGYVQVTLAVELKTDPAWSTADVCALTDAAVATLTEHGLDGRARILGFDWRVLSAARAASPRKNLILVMD